MKTNKKMNLLFISTLAIALSFINLNAFSLGSKIVYLEKLKQEAVQAEEEGYYDKSIELSKKIKEQSTLYEDLFSTVKKWYKLERQLSVAKQIQADKFSPAEYTEALDLYKESEINIIDEDYPTANINIDEGLRLSELAIQKSKEKYEAQFIKNKTLDTQPVVEVSKLNNYYVVRLIPTRRDSLWRIAEYNDIYNNPWKWKLIYQANRNIIRDPDLIYPGQKLIIPHDKVDFDEER